MTAIPATGQRLQIHDEPDGSTAVEGVARRVNRRRTFIGGWVIAVLAAGLIGGGMAVRSISSPASVKRTPTGAPSQSERFTLGDSTAVEGVARRVNRRRKFIGGLVIAVLAAGLFGGGMAVQRISSPASVNPAPTDAPSQSEHVTPAASFAPYTGAMAGFDISVPRTWRLVEDMPRQVVWRVSGTGGVSVRRDSLQEPIDASNIHDMRAVTDAILSDPKAKLQIVTTDEVDVNGMPGIFYLYYYGPRSARGVHAHYFLFKGRQMYSVVFQVSPASRFAGYAATFDRVLETIRAR